MRLRARRRPWLEQLEDRCTPATVSYSGGSLTVSNPFLRSGGDTELQVIQQASGAFQVTDHIYNLGTYNVTGNITLNGSNAKDNIIVRLAAGRTLPGSLTIKALNGDDSITLDGNGTGMIGGSVSIDLSNGTDTVKIGGTTGLVIGGSTTLAAGAGTDTADTGQGALTQFNGTLAFYGFNTINSVNSDANTVLGSGLTYSMRIAANSSFKGIPRNFDVTDTVPGLLKFEMGALHDTVMVNSPSVGSLVATMGGSVVGDSLTLNTIVNGNAAVTYGVGPGTISVNAATTINANNSASAGFSLTMGDANNDYTGLNTGFVVNGNLTISMPTTGTTDQDITLDATVNKTSVAATNGNVSITTAYGDDTITVNGTVEGNITARLGEGDNNFAVNAFFTNLTFTAGSGNNIVDIVVPDVGIHNLTLTFGAGANDVEFTGGAGGGGAITINWSEGDTDDNLTYPTPGMNFRLSTEVDGGEGYVITETGTR